MTPNTPPHETAGVEPGFANLPAFAFARRDDDAHLQSGIHALLRGEVDPADADPPGRLPPGRTARPGEH